MKTPKPKDSPASPEQRSFDDETAAGEEIPAANALECIADTLGSNGDDRADAARILTRFAGEEWLVVKGPLP